MMRRVTLAALCLAALAGAAPTDAATLPASFHGYSWETGGHRALGSTWNCAGVVDELGEALTADFSTREYTCVLRGARLAAAPLPLGSGGVGSGAYTVYQLRYEGGRFDVYEDAARNADWSAGPPSSRTLSTFTGGTSFLSCAISDIVIYATVYASGADQSVADCRLVVEGGTHAGQAGSGEQHLSLVTKTRATIPTGYRERVDTQHATPAAPATWGAIKGLFRR